MSRSLAGSIVDDRERRRRPHHRADHRHGRGARPDRRQRARGRRDGRLSRRPGRAIRACTRWCWRSPPRCCCSASLAATPAEARAKAQARLDDGSAAETFARMVAALDGPSDFSNATRPICRARASSSPVWRSESGFIAAMETREIGITVINLGGGRRRASDPIDPAVGLSAVRGIGTQNRRRRAARHGACGERGGCRGCDRGAAGA